MKNLISLLLLLSAGLTAFAQNIKTSVYFNSGEYELSEESVKELSSFLNDLSKFTDFDLDLYAYTDDIGKKNYNKKLAKSRVQSIKDFLDTKKITPNNIDLKSINHLVLQDNKDVAKQRANYRRVDLVAIPFQPKSLDDLYTYMSNKNTEQFTIRADRDTTLRGKKGTIVFIPAGTFQTVEGLSVEGKNIRISLQEAYSHEDILLSNLTTMSGDQLLETGGMVHIDAVTAQGEQLSINPKKEISLTMPSKEELPEGMQLFYGDRSPHDIAQDIDWEVTNQPFRNTNFDQAPPEFGFSSINMTYINNLKQLDQLPSWPKYEKIGIKPIPPKQPTSIHIEKPTLAAIIAEHPKKKIESTTRYEQRTQQLFEDAQKKYKRSLVSNKNAQQRYQLQLASYHKAMRTYQEAVASNQQYQQELQALKEYICTNQSLILDWSQTFDCLGPSFMAKIANAFKASQGLQDYRNYLIGECQRFEMNDLAATIQESKFNTDIKFFEHMARKFMRCARNNQAMSKNRGVDNRMKNLKVTLTNTHCLSRSIFRKENNRGHSIEEIYNSISNLSLQSNTFNRLIDNYNEVLKTSGFHENAVKLDTLGKLLRGIHEKIMDEKVARGLISKENAKILDGAEAENYYLNTIGINRLGWINCDRLINRQGYDNVISIQNSSSIRNTSSSDVRFFLVSNNNRSVTSFSPADDNQGKLVSFPFPANSEVTVIGFRIDGHKAQACKYEGKMKDLTNLTVEFKDYNLKELQTLLSHI
ncbi:MAG: OmpA family protein [Saprospiraceae bacterium]|nr:OmpA family protein [Saprospiraceae bacterium]